MRGSVIVLGTHRSVPDVLGTGKGGGGGGKILVHVQDAVEFGHNNPLHLDLGQNLGKDLVQGYFGCSSFN